MKRTLSIRISVVFAALTMLIFPATQRASAQTSAPAVNNAEGASIVGMDWARLNGNLVSGGTARVTIYWGANTNAWNGTNSLGDRSAGLFSTNVTGLAASQRYFYRCYATNDSGAAWADSVAAFTTAANAPIYAGGTADGHAHRAVNVTMRIGTVLFVR